MISPKPSPGYRSDEDPRVSGQADPAKIWSPDSSRDSGALRRGSREGGTRAWDADHRGQGPDSRRWTGQGGWGEARPVRRGSQGPCAKDSGDDSENPPDRPPGTEGSESLYRRGSGHRQGA